MVLYTIHHTCGHTSEEPRYGIEDDPLDDGIVIDRDAKTVCWPCRRGQYNQENDDATAYAEAQGWPAFTEGTPKQIAWAQTIRRDLIEQATHEVRSLFPGNRELLELTVALLLDEVDARWWINQRFEVRKWPRHSWIGFLNRPHIYPQWVAAAATKSTGSLFEELLVELENVTDHSELGKILFRARCALQAGQLRAGQLNELAHTMTHTRLRLDAEWGS